MLSASIGPDKPLTVNESSYHIFVVQFSADNMNFSLEINSATILTHTSSSTTVRHTCTGPEHPTDYIAICKAPLYVTAHPEAASIHIQSWGSQYWWDIVASYSCPFVLRQQVVAFVCGAFPKSDTQAIYKDAVLCVLLSFSLFHKSLKQFL